MLMRTLSAFFLTSQASFDPVELAQAELIGEAFGGQINEVDREALPVSAPVRLAHSDMGKPQDPL